MKSFLDRCVQASYMGVFGALSAIKGEMKFGENSMQFTPHNPNLAKLDIRYDEISNLSQRRGFITGKLNLAIDMKNSQNYKFSFGDDAAVEFIRSRAQELAWL